MKAYVLITAFGIFISGLIIGAIITCLQISTKANANSIDFNAFSGLLLASISVIFTFFGVFVAVLAFFGFNIVRDRVEDTARSEIEKSAKDGPLKDHMREIVMNELTQALRPGGEFYKLATDLLNREIFRSTGLVESSGYNDPEEDRT